VLVLVIEKESWLSQQRFSSAVPEQSHEHEDEDEHEHEHDFSRGWQRDSRFVAECFSRVFRARARNRKRILPRHATVSIAARIEHEHVAVLRHSRNGGC